MATVFSWLRDHTVMRGMNAVFCDLCGRDGLVTLAVEEISPRMAGYICVSEDNTDRVHAQNNKTKFHSVEWNGKSYVSKQSTELNTNWLVQGRAERLQDLSCVTHVFARVDDRSTLEHICRLVTNSTHVRYCILQYEPGNVDVVEFLEKIKEATTYYKAHTVTLANKDTHTITSFRVKSRVHTIMQTYGNMVVPEGMMPISLNKCFSLI